MTNVPTQYLNSAGLYRFDARHRAPAYNVILVLIGNLKQVAEAPLNTIVSTILNPSVTRIV